MMARLVLVWSGLLDLLLEPQWGGGSSIAFSLSFSLFMSAMIAFTLSDMTSSFPMRSSIDMLARVRYSRAKKKAAEDG